MAIEVLVSGPEYDPYGVREGLQSIEKYANSIGGAAMRPVGFELVTVFDAREGRLAPYDVGTVAMRRAFAEMN